MSATYNFGYKTGATLYFVLTDPSTGNVWNGTAFEAPNLANWANYARPMTETTGMGRYQLAFPAGVTTRGRYSLSIRKSSGTAAATDIEVGGGDLGWTGTDITSLESLQIYPNFDLLRALQKTFSTMAGPTAGAGSGHVTFSDPTNATVELECDVDTHGNRSNMNYHS